MKPQIDSTTFGSVTIGGEVFPYDVHIRLDGNVRKRKKKLSKAVYGTSHTISLDEATHIYEKGCERLIVGTGQYGVLNLSEEARDYFRKKSCRLDIHKTPVAIELWNEAKGKVLGLFHVTC